MRLITFCMCGVLLATALRFASASGPGGSAPATPPSSRASSASQPTSRDAGSDQVAAFYVALIQPAPPTVEQEAAIFGDIHGLREGLIAHGVGTAKDAVFLLYCRKHKDLFTPKNVPAEQLPARIYISSTYDIVRSVSALRETPKKGYGWVNVVFADDPKNPAMRMHTLVFCLGDGKLEADNIQLDSTGRPMSETSRTITDMMSDEFDPPGTPK